MTWPIEFFAKVIYHLARNSKWVGIAIGVLLWVVGFIEHCIKATFTRVADLLASLDLDALQGASLTVIEWIGFVNAIAPVEEFVTLFVIYAAAWSTVILIRWIKSFVPTVSN